MWGASDEEPQQSTGHLCTTQTDQGGILRDRRCVFLGHGQDGAGCLNKMLPESGVDEKSTGDPT